MSKSSMPPNEAVGLASYEARDYLLRCSLFGYNIRLFPTRRTRLHSVRNRVAIVLLHENDVWGRRAMKSLISTIANAYAPEVVPEFDVYSADANVGVLHTQVCQAIEAREREYAFVATMGTWTSVQLNEYALAHNWTVPQLFVGVHDPVGVKLVKTMAHGDERVVGVAEPVRNFFALIKLLKGINPKLRTVLIPHDPQLHHPGFLQEKARLIHELYQADLAVREVGVFMGEDIREKLQKHLQGVDLIWLLADPVTNINMKKLVAMCNKENIPLMGSDLAALFQGASLGFGDSGSRVGILAGQLGYSLLTGQQKPSTLPVVEATYPTVMRINPAAYEMQGLEVERSQRILLEEVVPLGWE